MGNKKGFVYEKTHEMTCVVCGATFYASRNRSLAKYCSDSCRFKASYKREKERNNMSVWQYEYLKLQAHQNDTSVWCRDYADKQKAKTLEMVGKIDLKEYLSCGTCKHKSSCGFQGWKNDCQFYEEEKICGQRIGRE